MRALCGAIITAGSLVGLGLLSIGIGTRYQAVAQRDIGATLTYIPLKDLDAALLSSLFLLIVCAVIGLSIAFVGLAYHHHRRYHEHLHATSLADKAGGRITV